ncbi:MAG: hypothetical protein RLZ35_172 [Pseudomonadota bacterium]|jgi:hypothetical protein
MTDFVFEKSMIQKNYPIPKIFHYIWVGGKLPLEYLNNLQFFSRICQESDYTVNIWVDNSSYFENRDDLGEINHLRIRYVDDLLEQFSAPSNSAFTDTEKADFIKILCFEYLAPANYAAISDFLRIEILRQEGGIYIDTDVMLDPSTDPKKIQTLDFSLLSTVGIANAFRNNNLIVSATNHPALIASIKMMLTRMLESHSISEKEYLAVVEKRKKATSPADRAEFNCALAKYFKDEHAWYLAKKSTHIIPYAEIGHEAIEYGYLTYRNALIANIKWCAPLRWHLTLFMGPDVIHKNVIAWQNFLESQNIISLHICFGLLTPLEILFNTERCDNTWCSEDTFVHHSLIKPRNKRISEDSPLIDSDIQGNSELEKIILENSVNLFEKKVAPLTFSDLSKRLHHFPEEVINDGEIQENNTRLTNGL